MSSLKVIRDYTDLSHRSSTSTACDMFDTSFMSKVYADHV